jgi:hypothetical protein
MIFGKDRFVAFSGYPVFAATMTSLNTVSLAVIDDNAPTVGRARYDRVMAFFSK